MSKAIVFIHGIVETTYQFSDLVTYFEDYTCYNFYLPGHGEDALNFGKNGLKSWQEYVKNLILFVKSKHDEVYAIGHSMGCLLLTDFCYRYPGNIDKLICLAIPLKIKPKIKGMIDAIRVAFRINIKNNSYLLNKSKYYSIKPTRNIFKYYRWPFRYIDLFRLSYRAKKNILKLNLPILIINSKKDEMVSYKIEKYINQNIKCIIIDKSGHVIYDEKEGEYIKNNIREFITKKA